MPSNRITFIGGDLRQEYMAAELKKLEYEIRVYGMSAGQFNLDYCKAESLSKAMKAGTILICPIPFSKDQNIIFSKALVSDLTLKEFVCNLKEDHIVFGGCFSEVLKKIFKEKHIPYYDFMEMEEVAVENAIATAEGAIAEALLASPRNLHKSNCLVLGYGRCGKILADRLLGMKAYVSVAVRKEWVGSFADAYGYESIRLEKLCKSIGKFDFIFNTIPALILDKDKIEQTKPEVVVIDLASGPGGTDFEACCKLERKALLCTSLPGMYAPQTSANILNAALLRRISGI